MGLLSACGNGTSVEANQANNVNSVLVKHNSNYASVSLVEIEDGTMCAVLVGSGKGAISCDWK